MRRRYATANDMVKLRETIEKLGLATVELASWQAFFSVQQDPYVFNKPQREAVLKQFTDNPVLYAAFTELFRKHPPTVSPFASAATKR